MKYIDMDHAHYLLQTLLSVSYFAEYCGVVQYIKHTCLFVPFAIKLKDLQNLRHKYFNNMGSKWRTYSKHLQLFECENKVTNFCPQLSFLRVFFMANFKGIFTDN